MAYPKRITPNSQTHRSLYFDRDDIALLVQRLRKRFYMTFTRGFQMNFQYGGERLSFSPERPLSPASTRRNLKGLGVAPRLIEMAVYAVEQQAKEGFPKADHVRLDLWFRGLSPQAFAGEKIKEVVAATPTSTSKWDRRLRKCGRTWDDITLSDEAIPRITERLFQIILQQTVTVDALEKRLRRWKKGAGHVGSHGYGGHIAIPCSVDDP